MQTLMTYNSYRSQLDLCKYKCMQQMHHYSGGDESEIGGFVTV